MGHTRLRDFFYFGHGFVSRIYPAGFGGARSTLSTASWSMSWTAAGRNSRTRLSDKNTYVQWYVDLFRFASKVERDWLPCSSSPRRRYPYAVFAFYLAPFLAAYISSTAHSASLRTFEKLITRSSLSAAYITSPCCVRYFSSWLAQESMQPDCWLLRCLKHVRLFHDVTMDVSAYLCKIRLFPRWGLGKGSRKRMRSTAKSQRENTFSIFH